jgi:3-oxosteroid 1-dehydrogenase
MLREMCRYYFDLPARLRRRLNDRLTLGPALAARCRLSLMDRKVPLWLDSPLEDLVLEEGCVVGALVRKEGKEVRVRARKGVLLAAGGFEHNVALRQKYQPAPTGDEWTAGTETNTGDTIAMGEKIGASFDLLEDSWWCPVFRAPQDPFVRLVIFEKNLEGGIIVNSMGERFMNEALPYNDVGKATYRANTNGASSIPAYLVFDHNYRKKYAVGCVLQSPIHSDRLVEKRHPGFMKKDTTLRGLAQQIGVDAEGLVHTVG